jgi:hypothetical protein
MGLFGTTIVAGAPLTVRWSAGDADPKVRSGRLELAYDNRYSYSVSDVDGNDKTKHRTRRVVAVTHELFTGAPQPGEHETTIVVPTTPASAPDAVTWFVRLVLDRSGHDPSVERELVVTASSDGLAEWSSSEPLGTRGAFDIRIDAAPRVVRAGDTVRGTIDLSTERDVKARSIRVELLRRRCEENGIKKDHVEQSVTLEKGSSLAADQRRQLAFELPIVDVGGPSFDAEHNSQHWYVQAVIDRRMVADFAAQAEIVVYNS